jgi:hypothetical protein
VNRFRENPGFQGEEEDSPNQYANNRSNVFGKGKFFEKNSTRQSMALESTKKLNGA